MSPRSLARRPSPQLAAGELTHLDRVPVPRTATLLRERDLDVVAVPIGEFERLEGCVTCLSVRLRGA